MSIFRRHPLPGTLPGEHCLGARSAARAGLCILARRNWQSTTPLDSFPPVATSAGSPRHGWNHSKRRRRGQRSERLAFPITQKPTEASPGGCGDTRLPSPGRLGRRRGSYRGNFPRRDAFNQQPALPIRILHPRGGSYSPTAVNVFVDARVVYSSKVPSQEIYRLGIIYLAENEPSS
jgi:hypothetical protein